MYGRKPTRPVDLDLQPQSLEQIASDIMTVPIEETIAALERVREQLYSHSSQEIKQAQSKQKHYFDRRKRANPSIEVGTLVLLKNVKRINRMGDKLQRKWIGQYAITRDFFIFC